MGIFTAAIALFGKGGAQTEERLPVAKRGASTSERKSTILVIDDDPTFLETMRSLLRDEGYNVLTSSTGPKGLDMLRYAPRDIGAVMLDFNMPRFNGSETLQFLRKLCPQAKVLAVSGLRADELPAEFREGVERFVPKPFTTAELLKILDEVLQAEPAVSAVASAN